MTVLNHFAPTDPVFAVPCSTAGCGATMMVAVSAFNGRNWNETVARVGPFHIDMASGSYRAPRIDVICPTCRKATPVILGVFQGRETGRAVGVRPRLLAGAELPTLLINDPEPGPRPPADGIPIDFHRNGDDDDSF